MIKIQLTENIVCYVEKFPRYIRGHFFQKATFHRAIFEVHKFPKVSNSPVKDFINTLQV